MDDKRVYVRLTGHKKEVSKLEKEIQENYPMVSPWNQRKRFLKENHIRSSSFLFPDNIQRDKKRKEEQDLQAYQDQIKRVAGVHQFEGFYLTNIKHRYEDGYVPLKPVMNEVHIGRKEDIEVGKTITIISFAKKIAFANFVEQVFENVRRSLFPYILPFDIPEEHIRLVRVFPEAHKLEGWGEIEMNWDKDRMRYLDPDFSPHIEENAWYFQAYQKKVKHYANEALTYFLETEISKKYKVDPYAEEAHHLSLSDEAPGWLGRFVCRAKTESSEYVKHLGMPCIISTLLYLSGKRNEMREDYDRDLIELFLEEVTQLKYPDIHDCYIER
ncbi:hypothetical protein [Shimazuella kribbensis]|uniref:hypothetical protein n=1 Tax=Shimazuella kribbensis TaxID=139808 RepID=UPI000425ED6E|nr:hypothetical protein [Shimazuella kribbensis]